MSGGHFCRANDHVRYEMEGEWEDPELNDLFHDLFCKDLWNTRSGGLAACLDFWKSGDISEETYREHVKEFKKKWFDSPRDVRLEGYVDEAVENLRGEMYMMIGIECV